MQRLVWVLISLAACAGGKGGPAETTPITTGDTASTGETTPIDACTLAAESQSCPSCTEGNYTCTFEDVSATTGSCGDCQARAALYQALCDAGNDGARATLEAETVCAPEACVEIIQSCIDPCLPLCLGASEAADLTGTECDVACADTAQPDPGECVNTGSGCAFQ